MDLETKAQEVVLIAVIVENKEEDKWVIDKDKWLVEEEEEWVKNGDKVWVKNGEVTQVVILSKDML
jgi:hypothetical protein